MYVQLFVISIAKRQNIVLRKPYIYVCMYEVGMLPSNYKLRTRSSQVLNRKTDPGEKLENGLNPASVGHTNTR